MTMRSIDINQAPQPLAEYAEQADTGPIVVTKDGQPIAVVVSIENADLETVALSENPQFLAIIERSRHRHEREGGLSSDEVRRRLEVPDG